MSFFVLTVILFLALPCNAADTDIIHWLTPPDNVDRLMLQQGINFAQEGDWESARKQFEKLVDRAPSWPDALFNLALSYDQTSYPGCALLWYRAYQAANPEAEDMKEIDERAETLKAETRQRIDKVLNMKESIAKAVDAKDIGSTWRYFADIYIALGEEKTVFELAKRDLIDRHVTLSAAKSLVSKGRYNDALQAEKVLKNFANGIYSYEWLHVYMAIAMAKNGDIQAAIKHLNNADSVDKYDGHMAIMQALIERDSYANTDDALDYLLNLDADLRLTFEAYLMMIKAHAEKGRISQAETFVEKIDAIDFYAKDLYVARGRMAIGRKLLKTDSDEAHKHFYTTEVRLKTIPGNHDTWRNVFGNLDRVHRDAVEAFIYLFASEKGQSRAIDFYTSFPATYFHSVRGWTCIARSVALSGNVEKVDAITQKMFDHLPDYYYSEPTEVELGLYSYVALELSNAVSIHTSERKNFKRIARTLDWVAFSKRYSQYKYTFEEIERNMEKDDKEVFRLVPMARSSTLILKYVARYENSTDFKRPHILTVVEELDSL